MRINTIPPTEERVKARKELWRRLSCIETEAAAFGRRFPSRLTTIAGERMLAEVVRFRPSVMTDYLVVTYHSCITRRHRTLVVDNTGQVFLLLDEEQIALSTPNKYTTHLTRLLCERFGRTN